MFCPQFTEGRQSKCYRQLPFGQATFEHRMPQDVAAVFETLRADRPAVTTKWVGAYPLLVRNKDSIVELVEAAFLLCNQQPTKRALVWARMEDDRAANPSFVHVDDWASQHRMVYWHNRKRKRK